MNVFYIPNVGYVFNKKIWLRFEKLVEDLYNESQLLVSIYDENDEADKMSKQTWVNYMLYNGGKYEDV